MNGLLLSIKGNSVVYYINNFLYKKTKLISKRISKVSREKSRNYSKTKGGVNSIKLWTITKTV